MSDLREKHSNLTQALQLRPGLHPHGYRDASWILALGRTRRLHVVRVMQHNGVAQPRQRLAVDLTVFPSSLQLHGVERFPPVPRQEQQIPNTAHERQPESAWDGGVGFGGVWRISITCRSPGPPDLVGSRRC